jgi:sugar phosphate permease
MTSVDRATWGPAAGSVGAELGVTLAGLGVFATSYYIGYVISNVFGGFLSDWFGGRFIIAASMLMAGSFMIAFGQTTTALLGIAFQAGIGLFAGADYAAGVKLIASWFRPKDRGTPMGVFMTATSLGLVIANGIVPSLIQASGWRLSYHVFGAASIVVGLACLLLLRNGPEAPAQPNTAVSRDKQARQLPNLRPLLHNRDLFLLGLAGFGALWGTYGFITWSNLLMVRGHGIDPLEAGIVVVIFGIAAVVAKPLIGIVTDLFGGGRKIPIIMVLVCFVATLLLFGNASTLTQFLWIAPFLGVAAYVYSPLMVALIPNLSGTQLAGTAAGTTNAFWQLGSTIVPVVVGVMFQTSGSFLVAFLVLAAGPLLAILPMTFIRENRMRDRIADAEPPRSAAANSA